MSRNRKTRRNRKNRIQWCTPTAAQTPAITTAVDKAPSFKSITQDYNRKVFAFLLDVVHDPQYQTAQLRELIIDTLGTSKIHATYLIAAAQVLSRNAHLCKSVTANGTLDVSRLIIIGKHLQGLSDQQLQQIHPQLRELCDSPEWIAAPDMRKLLLAARLKVDEIARQKAAKQAQRREQAKLNKAKPVLITPLPAGAMEVTLRLQQETAQVFHQQLTLAAQKANKPADEYLYTYLTKLYGISAVEDAAESPATTVPADSPEGTAVA
ncbi:MAG: hypothetical protein Q4A82_04020 [Corynebacterium sp.]|nr:hypothetical protein [Corynebacterium sp.]